MKNASEVNDDQARSQEEARQKLLECAAAYGLNINFDNGNGSSTTQQSRPVDGASALAPEQHLAKLFDPKSFAEQLKSLVSEAVRDIDRPASSATLQLESRNLNRQYQLNNGWLALLKQAEEGVILEDIDLVSKALSDLRKVIEQRNVELELIDKDPSVIPKLERMDQMKRMMEKTSWPKSVVESLLMSNEDSPKKRARSGSNSQSWQDGANYPGANSVVYLPSPGPMPHFGFQQQPLPFVPSAQFGAPQFNSQHNRPPGGPRTRGPCYNCGVYGHFSGSCPYPKKM